MYPVMYVTVSLTRSKNAVRSISESPEAKHVTARKRNVQASAAVNSKNRKGREESFSSCCFPKPRIFPRIFACNKVRAEVK